MSEPDWDTRDASMSSDGIKFPDGPTRPPVPGERKPVTVREYTLLGKVVQALGLLAFGTGGGFAIIDSDWRWLLLGVLWLIVLGAISSLFKKEV
jgi:hypothetical protein